MLATINDLMDITGKSFSDDEVWQLTAMLRTASREIQKYTGQKLERQTHIWHPKFGHQLHIPQMPNVSITSVKDANNVNLNYFFDGVDILYVSNPNLLAFDYNPFFYGTLMRLTITYQAGYDIIPDDIKAICCQMAMRAFGADPLKSGMTQEAITNYSYQQGQAAAAGSIGMLPMETSSLEVYKRIRGPIEMSA